MDTIERLMQKKKIVAVSAPELLEEWKNTHLPQHSLCHSCQIILEYLTARPLLI